jgi:mRNA interferase HigB
LIVSLNFIQGACYIIWFGPHQSYDSINAERIPFDTKIVKK